MVPELSYKNADDVLKYRKSASSSKSTLKKRFEFFYILILALSSFTFFKPSILDSVYLRFSNFNNQIFLLLFLPAIPTIVKFIFKKNRYLFTVPMNLLTISILISMFMANFFWNQKPMTCIYGAALPLWGYTFYYYLMSKGISIQTIERIITIIGIAFIIFFLFSFSVYPIKIFEYKETNDRDFLRLFLYGDGFLFLFYFFAMNRFLTKKSYLWLALALAAYLCIILNQTRVYIVATAAITLWYFMRSRRLFLKILAMSIIVIGFLVLPQLDFIKGLQNKTQSDLGNTDEYIRVKAAKYFLNKFQQSPFTRVFGNGIYADKESHYSKEIIRLQTEKGFYIQDVGLVGLYTYLGLLGLGAYLMIFYKSLKTKLVENYDYLKMFMAFVICSCMTTDSTFSGSYVFPIVFTLYLYEHCRVEAQRTLVSTSLPT